jgi:hypothetical protein
MLFGYKYPLEIVMDPIKDENYVNEMPIESYTDH